MEDADGCRKHFSKRMGWVETELLLKALIPMLLESEQLACLGKDSVRSRSILDEKKNRIYLL
jgi:hypothetical protein